MRRANAWRPLDQNGLDAREHRGGLLGMTSRAHIEFDVRSWHAHSSQHGAEEVVVVMLAGAHHQLAGAGLGKGPHNRRGFRDIGPGADHVQDIEEAHGDQLPSKFQLA